MHATQGFNPEISASAKTAFETAVHQVTIQTDSCMKARVCFCCDCFLENGEDKTIPIKTLRKEKMKLLFKGNPGIPERLHKYYTVPNCPALKELILSPRATLIQHTSNTDGGYLCCNECYSFLHCGRLPTFAIANHKTIGEAPKCLASLNPVELALISKARTDKHIFQYYGGAHQTIKGWHTFYASDLNNLSAVMNTLESSSDKLSIATLLIGPFTTEQRKKVRQQSEVRVSAVRKALKWLSKHNIHYNDVDYMAQFADSVICIDSAGPDCPSICSRVETKYEFTDATEPSHNNGGTSNQEELRDMTLDRLIDHSGMEPTLIARSSHIRLRDYEGANLQMAFPLQFPFGFGIREVNEYHMIEKEKKKFQNQMNTIDGF